MVQEGRGMGSNFPRMCMDRKKIIIYLSHSTALQAKIKAYIYVASIIAIIMTRVSFKYHCQFGIK